MEARKTHYNTKKPKTQNTSKSQKPAKKNPNFKTQKTNAKTWQTGKGWAKTRNKTSKRITKDGQKIEDNKQTKKH